MSDLRPIRTVTGQREMLDILDGPDSRGLWRVRHTADTRTGRHCLKRWTADEIACFENDVAAGLR